MTPIAFQREGVVNVEPFKHVNTQYKLKKPKYLDEMNNLHYSHGALANQLTINNRQMKELSYLNPAKSLDEQKVFLELSHQN